jgi:large subunit ribosomal protein L35
MPKTYKMKTHKGAKDRFHATGTGKVMRTKGGKSHLRRNRSADARRQLDETIPASAAEKDRLKALLPYGAKYIK